MIHRNELVEAFDPETLHILSDAFDDAWQHVAATTHLNGSANAARTVLAKEIIHMAKEGERDRQRLIEGALRRYSI